MTGKINNPTLKIADNQRDICKCSACDRIYPLSQYYENIECPYCLMELFIVVEKKCTNCSKHFVTRSTDNYRYCRPCKLHWPTE